MGPTIVELIGLPGSGKSTCSALLERACLAQGIGVVDREEILRSYVRDRIYRPWRLNCGLRRYRSVRAIVSGVYRWHTIRRNLANRATSNNLCHSWRRWKRMPFQWLAEDMILADYFRESNKTRAVNEGVYVAAEGLAHHSAAIQVWSGQEAVSMLRLWLPKYSTEDLVLVHTTTPVDQAMDRMWSRGVPRSWPRMARSDPAIARNVLVQFASAIDATVKAIKSAGARVITLDNTLSIANLEQRVWSFISELRKST